MIDVNLNVTIEKPDYWDGYWERNNGLGGCIWDPDACSKILREYHQILSSRMLPNGNHMQLAKDLSWNGMKFGSDSVLVSFRYKNQHLVEEIKRTKPDYKEFFRDYIQKSCTIAGFTIFPKHQGSMNQKRGFDKHIGDRWDLTMECIRRFYEGENSPLSSTLEADADFYKLFGSFRGYVDFFFLQDCVSADYKHVDIWHGEGNFKKDALPENTEEYFRFIEKELVFLEKRKRRIHNYCTTNGI